MGIINASMDKIDQKKMTKNAQVLFAAGRALKHPLRMKILKFIEKRGNTSVTPIYRTLGLEQSVTSQHLNILRKENLVITKREGKQIFYKVNFGQLKKINKVADSIL